MQTPVSVVDQLLISANDRLLEENITPACVIGILFRESRTKPRGMCEPVRLITATGLGVKPGVDLNNGRTLLDIMNEPS